MGEMFSTRQEKKRRNAIRRYGKKSLCFRREPAYRDQRREGSVKNPPVCGMRLGPSYGEGGKVREESKGHF